MQTHSSRTEEPEGHSNDAFELLGTHEELEELHRKDSNPIP